MHDNAMRHVARIARAVLRELDIQEMELPAESPDLNPIEHECDRLNRNVRGCPVPPETLKASKRFLLKNET